MIKFRNAQLEVIEGKIISFDKKVFTGLIKSINSEIYPFNSKSFSIGMTNQVSIILMYYFHCKKSMRLLEQLI